MAAMGGVLFLVSFVFLLALLAAHSDPPLGHALHTLIHILTQSHTQMCLGGGVLFPPSCVLSLCPAATPLRAPSDTH